MIWYRIGCGEIEPSMFNGSQLVCTYVTVRELGATHNWINHPEYVKRAISAIEQYGTIDFRNPYEVLLQGFIDNFKPNYQENKKCWADILAFSRLPWNLNRNDAPKARLILDNLMQNYNLAFDAMNDDLRLIKANNKGKPRITKQDYSIRFRNYWATILNQYLAEVQHWPLPFGISLRSSAWNSFLFAESIHIEFYSRLDRSTEIYRPHDYDDALNLFYVKPTDVYWTLETKWNRYANDAKLTQRLFKG